jgi:hypothetical protein
MREIRKSGSMRGCRKRAVTYRACVLLYRALAVKNGVSSYDSVGAVLVRQLRGPHLSTCP